MHWNQALLRRVWFQLLLDRLNHQISQNTLHTHNRAWLFHSQLLLFDQASNPLRLRRCECSECGAPGATEGDFIDLDTAGLRRQCRVTAWQGWVRQTHGQDLFGGKRLSDVTPVKSGLTGGVTLPSVTAGLNMPASLKAETLRFNIIWFTTYNTGNRREKWRKKELKKKKERKGGRKQKRIT